jgi:GDP-L-fucose synthase
VRKLKLYIAGQEGMVGGAIYNLLKEQYNIINCKRSQLNLLDQKDVENWFKKKKPEIVINAAGRVGGILDNFKFIDEYIYTNTIIGFNLLNNSKKYNIKKFINLGSACIYPRNSKQPIKEEYLLSSKLEETNEGYALAKISTLKYCEYINKRYKKNYITLQPTNLYGEGDNFNLKSSHVIPALIKKFHYAKKKLKNSVEVWGSGNVKREFLNVDDLASAVEFVLKKKIKKSYINVGSKDYLRISELAKLVKDVTEFKGNIIYNKRYPDGVKKRKLDTTILDNMGWNAKIKIKDGLKKYYKYFIENYTK